MLKEHLFEQIRDKATAESLKHGSLLHHINYEVHSATLSENFLAPIVQFLPRQ